MTRTVGRAVAPMPPLEHMNSSPVDDGYRQIVEDAPFGVLRIDADFRVGFASRGARQTLSTVEPLVGSDFSAVLRSVWPEPFASEAISRFRHTLATGGCQSYPLFSVDPPGRRMPHGVFF